MRVVHERCCGLDIHKKFVVACLLTSSVEETVHKEVRTYSAMTNDLLALADWLRGAGRRTLCGLRWECSAKTVRNPRSTQCDLGRLMVLPCGAS
jgi:hypothetical protein